MIARYNNRLYYYVLNSEKNISNIITEKKEKALDGFIEHRKGIYIKNVLLDDLTDVFDVSYRIIYPTEFSDISDEWEVCSDICDIDGKTVKILIGDGRFQDWKREDKYTWTKRIHSEEIDKAKIVKTYIRRNGVTLKSPEIVVEKTDGRTLVKMQLDYMRSNL